MRYNIEECEYNGKRLHMKGWAVPEHRGDTLKVFLRDREKKMLQADVTYVSRPDVAEAMYGSTGDDVLGFILDYAAVGFEDLEICFDALEFDIDFARKPVRMKEEYDAFRKNRRRRKVKG